MKRAPEQRDSVPPPLRVEAPAPGLDERILAAAARLPQHRRPFWRRWFGGFPGSTPVQLLRPAAAGTLCALVAAVLLLRAFPGGPEPGSTAAPVLTAVEAEEETFPELPLFLDDSREAEDDPGDYLLLAEQASRASG